MTFTNKLCFNLCCSWHELLNGSLEGFLKRFSKIKLSKNKKFNFHFSFNFIVDEDKVKKLIDKYLSNHSNIENVLTENYRLNPENNMFLLEENEKNPVEFIPISSIMGGPNNTFFRSMFKLINNKFLYKNIFLIETDTFFTKDNCMDYVLKHIEETDFLISGSYYKGKRKVHKDSQYKQHLNGVAIYNVCGYLLDLLNYVEVWINKEIFFSRTKTSAYDVCIDHWLKFIPEGKSFSKKLSPIINNDLIVNVSDDIDQETSLAEIIKDNPNCILVHQKI